MQIESFGAAAPATETSTVEIATRLVGSPSIRYVANHPELGMSPTEGFDCSGFVGYVLQQAGVHVPDFIGMDGQQRPIRHASEFWDHYGVGVHTPEPGDLVFFSRNGRFPTHIGILQDAGHYIHAPGKDNTKVCVAELAYENIATAGVPEQRLLYATNPIGFKAPVKALSEPSYRYHQQIL